MRSVERESVELRCRPVLLVALQVQSLAKSLREICHGIGFFFVINHGVSESLCCDALQVLSSLLSRGQPSARIDDGHFARAARVAKMQRRARRDGPWQKRWWLATGTVRN